MPGNQPYPANYTVCMGLKHNEHTLLLLEMKNKLLLLEMKKQNQEMFWSTETMTEKWRRNTQHLHK